MTRRTWAAWDSAIERTRLPRIVALWTILLMLLLVLVTGCTTAQSWCDENPRACEVVVVAGTVCGAAIVGGLALSASKGTVHPRQVGPVAPTCTTGCGTT